MKNDNHMTSKATSIARVHVAQSFDRLSESELTDVVGMFLDASLDMPPESFRAAIGAAICRYANRDLGRSHYNCEFGAPRRPSSLAAGKLPDYWREFLKIETCGEAGCECGKIRKVFARALAMIEEDLKTHLDRNDAVGKTKENI